jgi:hypothetical protein
MTRRSKREEMGKLFRDWAVAITAHNVNAKLILEKRIRDSIDGNALCQELLVNAAHNRKSAVRFEAFGMIDKLGAMKPMLLQRTIRVDSNSGSVAYAIFLLGKLRNNPRILLQYCYRLAEHRSAQVRRSVADVISGFQYVNNSHHRKAILGMLNDKSEVIRVETAMSVYRRTDAIGLLGTRVLRAATKSRNLTVRTNLMLALAVDRRLKALLQGGPTGRDS